MSADDLGISIGLIIAVVIELQAYNDGHNILAAIGIFVVSIYLIGLIAAVVIGGIASLFEKK